jgi:hypothetical protein
MCGYVCLVGQSGFGYLDYAEFVSAPRTHELAKLNLSSATAA